MQRKPYPQLLLKRRFIFNGVSLGPTGENLSRADVNAYHALHRFIRRYLPFSEKGLCQSCYVNLANQISTKDGMYSGDLSTWEWSCRDCNYGKPVTIAKFVGRQLSLKTRERIRLAKLGKTRFPEARAQISLGKLGNKNAAGKRHNLSPETRARLLSKVGVKKSPVTRAGMSLSKLGNKNAVKNRESRVV
jgi:hypothetical protein